MQDGWKEVKERKGLQHSNSLNFKYETSPLNLGTRKYTIKAILKIFLDFLNIMITKIDNRYFNSKGKVVYP